MIWIDSTNEDQANEYSIILDNKPLNVSGGISGSENLKHDFLFVLYFIAFYNMIRKKLLHTEDYRKASLGYRQYIAKNQKWQVRVTYSPFGHM